MFICPRCNHKTDRKLNLDYHFNRKKPCKNVNSVELSEDVKKKALSSKINAAQNSTAKNHENVNSENAIHNDINGSHNTATSHSHNTNSNITLNINNINNINNLASDFPLLLKYENLYDHFCKDMPAKKSIDAKKKRLFSRAIRELNKFEWNEAERKIPQELDIKEIITMIRSLLDIPPKKKYNPKDIVYNTVALHDEKQKERYFYDINHVQEDPCWKKDNEFCILARINPMICAFERTTIKLFYQTWNSTKNDIIMDRLRRLYKIIVCLELKSTLSHLDPESFVNEVLDIDEDDKEFHKALQVVKERDIVNRCKRIFEYAKDDIKDEEDVLHTEVIDVQEEVQRITESVSKIIHRIFQQECSNNPEFLKKMNDVDAERNDRSYVVPEEYTVKYTKI